VGTQQNKSWESCFSLPHMAGFVSRFSRIKYTALTLEGKSIEVEADGLHARLIQVG